MKKYKINRRSNILKKEIEEYKTKGFILKPIRYYKKLIKDLISKYNNHSLVKNSYNLQSLDVCDWQELIEADTWDFTPEKVIELIEYNFERVKNLLYEKGRLLIYEDETQCHIFVYMRDIIGLDYEVTMWN